GGGSRASCVTSTSARSSSGGCSRFSTASNERAATWARRFSAASSWSSRGTSAMLLRIQHETRLTYSEPVSETVFEVRMAPPSDEDQTNLGYHLRTVPTAPVTI